MVKKKSYQSPRKTSNHVSIRKNPNILDFFQGVTGVTQFTYENKLITILGETHRTIFKCKYQGISTARYCVEHAIKNKSCKILVEFPPEKCMYPEGDNSLCDVYHNTTRNGLEDRYESVDIRGKFVRTHHWNDFDIKYLSEYILAFYHKNVLDFSQYNLPVHLKKYFNMLGQKMTNLANHIRNVVNKVENGTIKLTDEIIYNFMHMTFDIKTDYKSYLNLKIAELWAKVMDFHLLGKILGKDNHNTEIIILAGDRHRLDMNYMLEIMEIPLLCNLEGDDNECINLSNTYILA